MKNISEINDKILKILSKVLKIPTIEINDDFEMNKISTLGLCCPFRYNNFI